MRNDELTHHGVKGMKWGVRRYQPYGQGGHAPDGKSRGTVKSNTRFGSVKWKYTPEEARRRNRRLRIAIAVPIVAAAAAVTVASIKPKRVREGERVYEGLMKMRAHLSDLQEDWYRHQTAMRMDRLI